MLCYPVPMPRKARLDTPGAIHHVIARGIEGRRIFRDEADRLDFLERLGRVLLETRTRCYAWALMPNHLHLLLRTGEAPLALVMQRVLTGYAVRFNRRHRRQGPLFQNRYKSVLCQEEPYLLELVRYIHLNPLRAGLSEGLRDLERYPWCGHGAVLGKLPREWFAAHEVLLMFSLRKAAACRDYRAWVRRGVELGRRPELTGGGLVRSLGGWKAIAPSRRREPRVKGDERILGDGGFVETVLAEASQRLERRYRLRAEGRDLDWLVQRVADLYGMSPRDVLRRGKHPEVVAARSVLCHFAVRELGLTTVALARRLEISQPTVSQSARRGERIAAARGFEVLPEADRAPA
jgi:REP element-mobilizing transposase RayT